MTPRELEEYKALRATIRERGTVRVCLFLVGLVAWAALLVATVALVSLPVATFLPLFVLAGTFECVLGLHTGVERIGRYIQVFHENAGTDGGWEHRVMLFGQRFPGGGVDPLFCGLFWLASVVNFIAALLPGPVPVEWIVVGAGHVLFMSRVAYARVQSRRQRAVDLERFKAL